MSKMHFSKIMVVLKKRFLFPLIPVALLLIVATVLLTRLENKKQIQTVRQDDQVAYVEGDFVSKIKTPQGEFFRLKDPCPDNTAIIEQTFPVNKPANTLRVFISGGSFAMGDPYVNPIQAVDNPPPGFGGIPSWIEVLLKARYPTHNFEIINAAIGGQNSFRVKEEILQLLQADPDLIIVATGNNEGFVPRTPFNKYLHKWIVYRALKKTLLPDPRPEDRYFFPSQDPDTQHLEKHFRSNIDAIVKAAKEHHVALALATLPINLKYSGPRPTMIGDKTTDPSADSHIRKGRRLQKKGEYDRAIEAYTKSANQVQAARYIGECFEKKGEFETAKIFYKIVVQQDPKGRTRPSFNVYVREVCQKQGTILIDLEQAMEALSPTGIPDEKLFFDNCHLTWQGYYQMALNAVSVLSNQKPISTLPGKPIPFPTAAELIEKHGWQALYSYDPPKWWEFP